MCNEVCLFGLDLFLVSFFWGDVFLLFVYLFVFLTEFVCFCFPLLYFIVLYCYPLNECLFSKETQKGLIQMGGGVERNWE